ncbi:MAG: AMP-binding protein [Deltaproteobacteria bacterium]|nr:AMP-binding protein [Deltaproteobacteria bacterium]
MQALSVAALADAGLDTATAEALSQALVEAAARHSEGALALWRHASKEVLGPAHPFEVHRLVHAWVFEGHPASDGPPPIWVPGARELTSSNLARAMRVLGAPDMASLHALSLAEPERYWRYVLKVLALRLDAEPEPILDDAAGPEHARWLVGLRGNLARSALERADRRRVAVLFQREGGALERRTLAELDADSAAVARGLAALGFAEGDAAAIAMPMTYESVAIYLGIVRRGGAVVSIADSFAAGEIEARLRIGGARVVFTQDQILRGGKGLPLYARVDEAARAANTRAVVLPAGADVAVELAEGDLSWRAFLAAGQAVDASAASFVVRGPEDVTNVLFSSGTTGEPKAIPWTQVTPIKAAADAHMHHDVQPHDVVCWPTNLGWMMGPWLIYAALLNDATIALYQGSPLGRDFGEFVVAAGVTMLGVVPSLVKTWKGTGCMVGLDWSRIRVMSSTGEASTPHDMHWLSARAGYKPILEYCGGTEIGGGFITGSVVEPQAASAFSTPALGSRIVLLDDDGHPTDNGELALVPPLLGSSNRLLNRDHHDAYFEGMPRGPKGEVLRRHGDQVERVGRYYRALGRVDDTMNLGGIKTSSAELERACNRVEGVSETAAIAVPPEGGGPSLLVLFVVLGGGVLVDAEELKVRLQRAIARELNPLFKVHDVVPVDALPRTASNKVMRRVLRSRYVR